MTGFRQYKVSSKAAWQGTKLGIGVGRDVRRNIAKMARHSAPASKFGREYRRYRIFLLKLEDQTVASVTIGPEEWVRSYLKPTAARK